MKTAITFEIDTGRMEGYTDEYVDQLWTIAQANPAAFGDSDACELAELVGHEIIRRWLLTPSAAPALWTHQGCHAYSPVKSRKAESSSPSGRALAP